MQTSWRVEHSKLYGHTVRWLDAPSPDVAPSSLIEWGPHSITIPSGSALDRPARVTLIAPHHISEAQAFQWCIQNRARLVDCRTMPSLTTGSTIDRTRRRTGSMVVVFDVDGFSRYGFGQPVTLPATSTSAPQQNTAPRNQDGPPAEITQAAMVPPRRIPLTLRTQENIHSARIAEPRRIVAPSFDEDEDDTGLQIPSQNERQSTPDRKGAPWLQQDDFQRARFVDPETPVKMEDVQGGPQKKKIGYRTHLTPARTSAALAGVHGMARALFQENEQDVSGLPLRNAQFRLQSEVLHPFPWRQKDVNIQTRAEPDVNGYGEDSMIQLDDDRMSILPYNKQAVGHELQSGSEFLNSFSSPDYKPLRDSIVSSGLDIAHSCGAAIAMSRMFRHGWDGENRIFIPKWQFPPRGARLPYFACESKRVGDVKDATNDSAAIWNRLIPREGFVKPLRVHAVAWAVARAQLKSGGSKNPQVPGLGVAFSEGIGIADTVLESLIDSFAALEKTGRDPNAEHARIVFGALAALYRRASDPGDNVLRRVAVWLRGAATKVYDAPIPTTAGLPRALALLSIGDIDGAVQTAIEAGYLRLALLIGRAVESDKEDLRDDAQAQLEEYGPPPDSNISRDTDGSDVQDFGEDGRGRAESPLLSIEERLILCLLAGRVEPVVEYMRPSWYRVFAMELFYGAGSSNHSQPERIAAAVAATAAIADSFALPPHGDAKHRDAAYHLLRLYADPTASYSLTSGVFSACSFGRINNPLDVRFAWLLYQVLSALNPHVEVDNIACLSLALSSELSASGLALWSFYVLCCGAPPAFVKEFFMRNWPRMEHDLIEMPAGLAVADIVVGEPAANIKEDLSIDDSAMEIDPLSGSPERSDPSHGQTSAAEEVPSMHAFTFLVDIMKVPVSWVHEARAVQYRVERNYMNRSEAMLWECDNWLRTLTERGVSFAQDLLVDELFPHAVGAYDTRLLQRIRDLLVTIQDAKHPPSWSARGGLVLDYLKYLAVETAFSADSDIVGPKGLLMAQLKSIASRVKTFMSMAKTPAQRNAAVQIANAVACAMRVEALLNPSLIDDMLEHLERMPVSAVCMRRICAEIRNQIADGGSSGSTLLVSAHPQYSAFLNHRLKSLAVNTTDTSK